MTAILNRRGGTTVRVSTAPGTPSASGRPASRLRFTPATGAVVVLTYHEAATALYYCGTRLPANLNRTDIPALVLHGVARLGLNQVRALSAAHHKSGLALLDRTITGRQYDTDQARLWPASEGGQHQYNRAVDAVHSLTRTAAGAAQ
ncbi:hypothetical protein ATK36_3771 [Amycolatopsis sulphurea]|uniref:Uncharacterized protein n=1 Tax=Amycolatopsis sulphurea TaxID=76022 RepID=A0A2A9FE08_9PSEU|nr:hypothetical protein [Amycolatopsis sulphurea]PFG48669.1 hypothetical protein ATK36_3771 [Amycolatopsis sulphurea]